jgi:TIR domain
VSVKRREVFVSYSQSDRDSAIELVAWVESSGIECWMAPRDISPAADWAAEIIEAIAAAKVMVLVFSASTNNSPQVRREVERAVHKGVSVLPFRVEDVLPSKSLEYFLSSQHWLDAFPPPREPHYERLCAHLGAILSAAPAGEASEPAHALKDPSGLQELLVDRELDAAGLRQLETELASYVGPLAKHLVKRAASHCSGAEELILCLAEEIESDQDRRRFILACRQIKRAHS